MKNNNPLVLAVLSLLKKNNHPLSLYHLMKSLEEAGYELVKKDSSENNETQLFRKNFIVMNALYQLKTDLTDTGYGLSISSLKIVLYTELAPVHSSLPVESSDEISTVKALSDYYLNWENFHTTDEAGVEALLTQFWLRFNQYNDLTNENDKYLDSLQLLGLNSDASWCEIQKAYRQLIAVHHPDKGGGSQMFIKIRQAYLILKLVLNISS